MKLTKKELLMLAIALQDHLTQYNVETYNEARAFNKHIPLYKKIQEMLGYRFSMQHSKVDLKNYVNKSEEMPYCVTEEHEQAK